MRKNKLKFKQYFTPERISRFMIELLKKLHPLFFVNKSRIIDPACGDGAFLKISLDMGITAPIDCYGVDMDSHLNESWETSGLLGILGDNLKNDDGLFFKYSGEFDVAIGNPPFGLIPLNEEKIEQLRQFEVFNRFLEIRKTKTLPRSFPIEILFVERFINLCKPGGLIAIVLPEGITANMKLDYVRNLIWEKADLNAIVSLGTSIFRIEGTGARTSLIFLTKKKEKPTDSHKKVLMADALEVDLSGEQRDDLDLILEELTIDKEICTTQIPVGSGEEIIKNKHWKITMEKLRHRRWDPPYHHPFYENYMQSLEKGKYPLIPLKELIGKKEIMTAYKGVQCTAKGNDKIHYITSRQVTDFGIDFTLDNSFIDSHSPCNPERTRIRENDILLVRSGEGCIGRCIVAGKESEGNNIRSEIYLIRINSGKINPYYLCLFFHLFTVIYNRKNINFQVRRLCSGVGTPNLNKDEILSIEIPLIPGDTQDYIEKEYRLIRDDYNRYVQKKIELKEMGLKNNDMSNDEAFEKLYEKISLKMENLVAEIEEIILQH